MSVLRLYGTTKPALWNVLQTLFKLRVLSLAANDVNDMFLLCAYVSIDFFIANASDLLNGLN